MSEPTTHGDAAGPTPSRRRATSALLVGYARCSTEEINGEDAGLQWYSIEHDPEEEQPYQWSGAYAGPPFSLSVEGETQADRSAGLSELVLVPPSQVGLAPRP